MPARRQQPRDLKTAAATHVHATTSLPLSRSLGATPGGDLRCPQLQRQYFAHM